MLKIYVSSPLAGLALLGLAAVPGSAQTTFANPTAINIVDNSVANPYPSSINVTGLSGMVTKITVTLTNFSHGYTADVGAVLVGPGGQSVVLFDGAGGPSESTNLTWTFDDSAAAPLAFNSPLTSGTYQPNTYFEGDVFDAPGPGSTYTTKLSSFNGTTPNGTYNLYVKDFVPSESGVISGGWSVTISTSPVGPPAVPGPDSLVVFAGPGVWGLGMMRRRRQR